MSIGVYPWQSAIWSRVAQSRQRMHHALLIKGRHGTGKLDFAVALAQSLLCQATGADGHACGQCVSCNWFLQDSHPDYRLLTPEQEVPGEGGEPPSTNKKTVRKSSQISVAQVRELAGFLELSSHQNNGLRVIVIHPADALNQISANALLKLLEEPPADVLFILVTSHSQRLLPTIISRCQQVEMPAPEFDDALAWLEQQGVANASQWLAYHGGSPLVARQDAANSGLQLDLVSSSLAQAKKLDPFASAAQFASFGMEQVMTALQKWLYDMLSVRLTGVARYHHQHVAALQGLSKSVDLSALLAFQRQVDEARRAASHPLNNELQLEHLLLQYTRLFS
ncbi:DNA polymerase III subunit delta' [Methylobacillus caricis]|uniref:DNA polymerase III subunit delta' n=1 Tax=Methylobacillus caricis TaxID=1971611 RepID=UPI001CFFDE06|nr:DNA polymerase III subunit delta' [Methylobacillus caricis]MCB5187462.1 DNA polymerase III subunit delta' [Methylobacillus caricis]